MIEVTEYVTEAGVSPFAQWKRTLDPVAESRVMTSVRRLSEGNVSTVKGVASGLFEMRMDFGPGYRVYFGKEGETLVILLGGGTKKRQNHDIETARSFWQQYKQRKKEQPWR